MATVSMRHRCSQSAKTCKSAVKVANARTDSTSRSAGTATKISVAPISIPAAFGLITGKLRSNLRCLRLFVFAIARLRSGDAATSQTCKKGKLYQAGSSQHQQRLRVTNVIAHGSGIKLLHGLATASTNGVHDLH